MDAYDGAAAGGGVEVDGAFQVFNTGNDIAEADALKILFVVGIEAFTIVLNGNADAVFVADQGDIEGGGAGMFQGIMHTFLHHPVKDGFYIGIEPFFQPFGVHINLQGFTAELVHKFLYGGGEVVFDVVKLLLLLFVEFHGGLLIHDADVSVIFVA